MVNVPLYEDPRLDCCAPGSPLDTVASRTARAWSFQRVRGSAAQLDQPSPYLLWATLTSPAGRELSSSPLQLRQPGGSTRRCQKPSGHRASVCGPASPHRPSSLGASWFLGEKQQLVPSPLVCPHLVSWAPLLRCVACPFIDPANIYKHFFWASLRAPRPLPPGSSQAYNG